MSSKDIQISTSTSSKTTESASPLRSTESAISSVSSPSDISPQTLFSAAGFKSESEATAFMLTTLEERRHPAASLEPDFYFVDVPRDWGKAVFFAVEQCWELRGLRKTWNAVAQTLRFKMPTPAHNCAQPWLHACVREWELTGALTPNEIASLNVVASTTQDIPQSPYSSSQKDPDVMIFPEGYDLRPANAFEVGWSETTNELDSDAEMLLRGHGTVNVVVTIKWRIHFRSRTVRGDLIAWRLGQDEIPFKAQHEVIFPAPNPPRPQHLLLSLADIFSSAVPPGRNPLDNLRLDISLLRCKASSSLNAMNLSPA
ncbi:hypothetical protein PMG11_04820 [Penicillium brasilianum]|uniref:Uncharacterized protein n=1 Tax=Penicillium brasilianum TaxID=104259 RepID=A0A0F7VJN0_PENBI|nr:hypothetical protein PMG11_04820 [Penicillium brasilianum]